MYLHLRWPQTPITSQPHRPSCSSGTQCEWIIIREQTLQMWRRRSNNTRKTTRETVATRTFQRDTWVLDTSLFGGCTVGKCYQELKQSLLHFSLGITSVCERWTSPEQIVRGCCMASVLCCDVFQMDLMPFVNKAGCECLNESDDCGFDNCLNKEPSYLESDCDEQVSAAELPSKWNENECIVFCFFLNYYSFQSELPWKTVYFCLFYQDCSMMKASVTR